MHTNLSFKEDISASEINSTQNAHWRLTKQTDPEVL
jgi:hypothetical protein